MGYRYSLALVSAVITFPGLTEEGNPITKRFGGQGSMIGTITMARTDERFSAEGDPTGGFVINETLSAVGTCTISIKQFAPLVNTLTNLFLKYDTTHKNFETLNVQTAPDTLSDACSIKLYYAGKLIAVANACYLNMPELAHEEENSSRDFTFVCGEIDYKVFDNNQIGMKI